MYLCRIVLVGIALLTAVDAYAQSLVLRNLSVADGLSQSTINHLLQDAQGYMWIATGDGLNRFDGRSFKHFHYNPTSENSLPSNMVRQLCEDRRSKLIWIGTDNGLGCYNQSNGKISQPFAALECLKETYTSPLFCDNQYVWCCAGNKGILKLNVHSKEVEYLVRGTISFFAVPHEGAGEVIYRTNTDQIYRLSLESGAIDSLRWNPPGPLPLELNIYKVGNHGYRMYSSEGAYELNFKNGTVLPILHEGQANPDEIFQDEIRDAEGNRYIAIVGKGVVVYDACGNVRHRFTEVYENIRGEIFDLKNVRSFFKDSNGAVWCATDGCGVVLINLRSELFEPMEWLDDQLVLHRYRTFSRCIAEVDNHIWVAGYRDGITLFDPAANRATTILRNDNRVYSVSAILEFEDGVYIGSDVGLYRLNKPYDRSALVPIKERLSVNGMVELADHFCIATNGGIYTYYPDRNELQHWDVVDLRNTTCIIRDESDNLLIGLSGEGLAVVRSSGEVLRLRLETLEGVAPPNIQMNAIRQVGGKYYIATNHGLFVLQSDFSREAHFGEAQGLASSHLYGLLTDSNGRLWVSTNAGVSRFDPANGKFVNYTTADGLQSMEHNRSSFLAASNGVFYMGGTTGVSRFVPAQMQKTAGIPAIRLSGIQVMNVAEVNVDSLVNGSLPLRCVYNQNNLQFEVAVLDFFRPDRYEVEYKLEGWDKQFLSLGSDRFIRYTNLPPGTYVLLVRLAGGDNVPENRLLTIIIESPVWRRGWFMLAMIVLLVALIVFINSAYIRLRSRKAEAALERAREIEKMRSRISKDIHDEVGAGLTKIALMSEAAKVNQGSKDEVSATLDKLADASRNITKGLHEIIWSVNPDEDNSASLFDHINQFAREFLEETEITLNLQMEHAEKVNLNPAVRRNIFLIVKEALNNCVKHAQASNILLSMRTTTDNAIVIVIHDDGCGVDLATAASGHGLRNMQSRALQCGMSLQVHSEVGKGTTVRLSGTPASF